MTITALPVALKLNRVAEMALLFPDVIITKSNVDAI